MARRRAEPTSSFAELLRTSPRWRTARARGLCESIIKPLELGIEADTELIRDPKRKFGVALCMALYAVNNPDYFDSTELPTYISAKDFDRAMDIVKRIYREEGLG